MSSYQAYPLAAVLLFCSLVSAGTVAQESEKFDAEAKYQATCFACHGTGQAHAPVVGDIIEWEIRLEKGFDTLVQSTINGLNGICLLYTSPSPRDVEESRMPSSA